LQAGLMARTHKPPTLGRRHDENERERDEREKDEKIERKE